MGWQVSQMLTVFWISAIWDDAVKQLQKSIVIQLSNVNIFLDKVPPMLVDSSNSPLCKTQAGAGI